MNCNINYIGTSDFHGRCPNYTSILKGCFIPLRTDSLKNLATDLFLPTLFNHALKINNIALKVIASIAAIILDLITLLPRTIATPFRVVYCRAYAKTMDSPLERQNTPIPQPSQSLDPANLILKLKQKSNFSPLKPEDLNQDKRDEISNERLKSQILQFFNTKPQNIFWIPHPKFTESDRRGYFPDKKVNFYDAHGAKNAIFCLGRDGAIQAGKGEIGSNDFFKWLNNENNDFESDL